MIGRQIQQATPRPGSGLTADLFLLHAPSVYDFRERDDMLFAYLSDSDNVTSVYEMNPIGWFSIRQRLADCGFDAKIVNVASLTELVDRVRRGSWAIPNLLYKADGEVQATSFTHKPTARYNNARNDLIAGEPHTMKEAAEHTSIYALQCYSENKTRMHQYLDAIQELGYRSVSFEKFNLTPQDTLRKIGESTEAYIMLSPESHDPKISAAAGRDTCTMAEMEDWIPRALDAGVKGIMVWFFIGMPYQDRQSALDTVSYSERLIRKFGGWKALPVEPLWRRRLNYETRWLDRRQLPDVSYEAIARLDDATVPQQMIEDCRTSRPGPASLAAA